MAEGQLRGEGGETGGGEAVGIPRWAKVIGRSACLWGRASQRRSLVLESCDLLRAGLQKLLEGVLVAHCDAEGSKKGQEGLFGIRETSKHTRGLCEGAVTGDNFSIMLNGGELSLLDCTYVEIEHDSLTTYTRMIDTHLIRARRWGCTAGHLSPSASSPPPTRSYTARARRG